MSGGYISASLTFPPQEVILQNKTTVTDRPEQPQLLLLRFKRLFLYSHKFYFKFCHGTMKSSWPNYNSSDHRV